MSENSKVTVVMYHYVRNICDSRYPSIKGLELNDFKTQIAFLTKNYNIVSLDHIMEAIQSKAELPENAALLTFDDGYIDHYTNVFPVLLDYGITGVFSVPGKILKEGKVLDVNKVHFILASADQNDILVKLFELLDYYRGNEYSYPSNEELFRKLAVASRFDTGEVIFIKRILQTELPEELRNIITDKLFKEYINISEKAFCNELYMSFDQVKTMKKQGMSFALHGYDHYWLGALEHGEMEADIRNALEVFDGIIDPNEWAMCYPYGSANENVKSFIKSNGCFLGFGTNVATADLKENDLLFLPRLDTNDFPPRTKI